MTRIILHIGPHKTGTTYIQHMLDAMRDVLLEHDIYIPSIWNASPSVPAHKQLVRAIRTNKIRLVQEQIDEILTRQYRSVVISCEGLSTLTQGQVFQLRRIFRSAPVQVVHYVRRWSERLPSAWQEHVRQGDIITLPEFIARQTMGNGSFAQPDLPILDKFSAVFGADQVKIVSYSYLVDNDIDIANHFLTSFLDMRYIEQPKITRLNRSSSIFDTELIRALNAIRTPRDEEWSTTVMDWYVAQHEGFVPDFVMNAMRDSLGSFRLDETTRPLVHLSRDVLTRYASSLVAPFDTNTLHELRAIDVPFVRPDYLFEPSVPQFLRDSYAMCCPPH